MRENRKLGFHILKRKWKSYSCKMKAIISYNLFLIISIPFILFCMNGGSYLSYMLHLSRCRQFASLQPTARTTRKIFMSDIWPRRVCLFVSFKTYSRGHPPLIKMTVKLDPISENWKIILSINTFRKDCMVKPLAIHSYVWWASLAWVDTVTEPRQ